MTTPHLGETLLAYIGALDAPATSGVVVTAFDLTVPLEVTAGMENGEVVMRASAPHTRWVSGFLPPVHLAHLRIEATETGGGSDD
jgi:hypothetical protein